MKRIFTFFLALVASVGTMFASNTNVNGIWYDFDTSTKTASVTYQGSSWSSYSYDYSGEVVVPASVTYNSVPYSVTSIRTEAFRGCSGLTSVTIPNSVTSIGDRAFYGCIGLTSVTIPNSVTSIGGWAFHGCTSLTSPVYNAHVFAFMPTSYSGGYTIPDGIEYIASAFEGCKSLTSITIPNSVTSIGSSAFSGCTGLTSVTIPNSVTSIGDDAFHGCTSLTSIEIPNSVTSIGDYAFSGCTGLTTVTIPNSVTSIGNGAFSACKGLTTPIYNAHIFAQMPTSFSGAYTIPEGIEMIAGNAFASCKIKSITIPSSLKQMAERVFGWCVLDTVVWNAKHCDLPVHWTDGPFNSARISTFIFGDEVEYIPHDLCREQNEMTSINIPSSVTIIADGAFKDCTGLTKVNINDIAAWCNIVFSSSPLYYAKHLYLNDIEVTNLVIPDNVSSIGKYAFYGCIDLTSVTISNSVTSIGDYAFFKCTGLTSVTIPNSVTSIGYDAFYGCTGLTSMTIEAETPPMLGSQAFDNTNNCPIYVPCGTLDAYKNKIGWSKYASQIEYKPLEYKVIGKVNSIEMGSVKVPTSSICDSLNAIPNEGYHFVQWSDGIMENPRVIDFTQDTTLTAEFAINVYHVRFYGLENFLLSEQSVEHGAAAIAPEAPVEENYDFIGWDKDFSNVQADLDVYAQYKNKSEAIENIEHSDLPYKILDNGNIYILRREKVYTVTGQEVR